MKIGILIWQLDIKGGTQRQALELAQHMAKKGHDVVMYAYLFDKEKCYPELCEGLNIKYVKRHDDSNISDYPKNPFEFFVKYLIFYLGIKHRKLLQIIDDDVDVLNPHDTGTYVTAGLWKVEHHKPVIWMMNDLPLFKWNARHMAKTIGYHIKPRYRRYIRSFEKIIVLDDFNKKRVMENFHIDSRIIRSGLDRSHFSFIPRENDKKYKIFMMSVLLPHRRMEDAVRALGYLIDWGYDVRIEHVGVADMDLVYSNKVRRLIKKWKLEDHIAFHGPVSSQRLSKFFRECDFYLFPNSPQTWGLSVFESMACGMPVVLTSGCGASEILTDRENSLIIDPYSPAQIAQAIARLIYDKRLNKRIVDNACAFVNKNISWESYSQQMLEQIEEVCVK